MVCVISHFALFQLACGHSHAVDGVGFDMCGFGNDCREFYPSTLQS